MNWKDALSGVKEFLDLELFILGDTQVTVVTLLGSVLIVLSGLWLSKVMQRGLTGALRARGIEEEGLIGVARRLLHYLVLTLAVTIALNTLGIKLATLFAAGALFAVGLGFALQNVTENFLSGVILLAERAIKPGDILEVDGTMVRVVHMGLRSTVGRTLNEEEIVLPNSLLVQGSVKNYTLRDSLFRLRAPVGVSYASDLGRVREALGRAAQELPGRSQKREPVILLRGFGDSSVNFEVSVWLDHPWDSMAQISQLNFAIWNALKEAGITIAFPQLDLHLDAPVVEAMAQ